MKKDPMPLKLLKATRKLLSNPKKWTQGASGRDRQGYTTDVRSSLCYSFCLVGGIDRISHQLSHYYKVKKLPGPTPADRNDAIFYLQEAIKAKTRREHASVITWNDRRTTHHQDVLNLLDQAIANYRK